METRTTCLSFRHRKPLTAYEPFGQADALSRLIATHSPPEEDVIIAKIARDINAIFHENVKRSPVTAKDVARATAEDDTLRQVLDHIAHNNWPKKPSSAIASYAHLRNDLSTQQGCLLFGSRIIIPRSLQPQSLKILHEGHPGINRMESLARSYVFCTRINEDLENWFAPVPIVKKPPSHQSKTRSARGPAQTHHGLDPHRRCRSAWSRNRRRLL
ncbi:unnamed protein product [Haemonchus placei]|uniref:RNA-directed DNA polymerase n=1 Tax=Haemonchus placei TaxID=6290 RepID=A0A3P7Y849_HAEPC|nr:unnamed protein product [Haemonchus placei]